MDKLFIDIDANIDGFNRAVDDAKSRIDTFSKTVEKNAPRIDIDVRNFQRQLNKMEKEFEDFYKRVNETAGKQGGVAVDEATIRKFFAQNKKLADDLEKEQLKAIKLREQEEIRAGKYVFTTKQKLWRQEQAEIKKLENEQQRSDAKVFQAKIRLWKQEQNEINKQAKAEERLKDMYLRGRRKNIAILMNEYKHMDRSLQAIELNRIRKMSNAEIRRQALVLEGEKKLARHRESFADQAIHRSLYDSVRVVARYGIISQALYGMQNAFAGVIREVGRYDQSIYQNMAVLGQAGDSIETQYKKAEFLASNVVKVGIKFGTTFEEIQEGMITLGRAGVDSTKQLADATEGLAALSIVTGDAMHYGAAAVASLLAVYPELNGEIDTLLNKMGEVANATRLGLEDFSTISNYALTTAQSIGLSSDAFLALAGSLSKVGLNASTIGTSIRRLDKFTSDSSKAVVKFFDIAGQRQRDFAKTVRDNPLTPDIDESIEGLSEFTKRLARMTDAQFAEAVADLNIQMRATAKSLRAVGQLGELEKMIEKIKEARDVTSQAEKNAIGLERAWQSTKNQLASIFNKELESTFKKIFDRGNFIEFQRFLETFSLWVKNVVVILKGIGNAIGFAFNAAAVYIGQKLNTMLNFFANFGAHMQNIWKGVVDFLMGNITKFVQFVVEELNSLITSVNGLGGDALKFFGIGLLPTLNTVDDYVSKIEEAKIETKDYFDVAGDVKDMQEYWTDMGDNVDTLIGNVKEYEEVMKTINKYELEGAGMGVNSLPPEVTAQQLAVQTEIALKEKLLGGLITEKQYRVGKITAELKAQQVLVDELAKKAKKEGVYSDAAAKIDEERLKLLDLKLRLKNEENKVDERAGNANAQKIRELIKEAELRGVILENVALASGHLMTQYEQDQISLDIANEKVLAAAEAYNSAVALATNEKGMVALKQAELKLHKAIGAQLKEENKQALRFATEMKKAGESFFDAFTEGDMKKAFKGLFDDIKKAFLSPLRDAFSDLFGNKMQDMVGGFYDQLVEFTGNWATYGFEAAYKVAEANAIAAVTNQGSSGDPYTAWARMAAMAATVASLGIAVAGSFGGTGEMSAEQEAAFAGMDASEFTDESISNLIDAFESAQYPMLEVTNKMYKHLRNMDKNFYSIAKAIAGTTGAEGVDITGGSFAEGIYDASFYSSKTKELLGAGIYLPTQTLEALSNLETIAIEGYESIKTVKDYWWKTSITYSKNMFDLPAATVDLFAKTFAEGYQTIFEAGIALGFDEVDLAEALNNATISVGEGGFINLEGLDQQGVADAMNAIFSTIFSDVINQIGDFDVLIERYTQGVEQSMETLTRIALEYDQASFSFSLIGKEFTDGVMTVTNTWTEEIVVATETVASDLSSWFTSTSIFTDSIVNPLITSFWGVAEAVAETVTRVVTELNTVAYTAQMQILDIVESAGGLESFQDAMTSFMTNFYTDAEQLIFMQKALAESFSTLGIEMPQTNEEFRLLLETMDTSTEEGAYLYGQVLLLAESFAAMTTAAESLNEVLSTEEIEALADAWLGELSYLSNAQKTAYASSYYDIMKEFQDINDDISTVDAARSAAEAALKTTATKEEYIPYFEKYVDALEGEVPEATLDTVVTKLDEVVIAIKEMDDNNIRISV